LFKGDGGLCLGIGITPSVGGVIGTDIVGGLGTGLIGWYPKPTLKKLNI